MSGGDRFGALSGRAVLVVDDEPHLVAVVAFNLRRAGATVATAGDGAAGLAAARAVRPDVVITDYQMPMMDGLTLCRHLRLEPATAGVPVLMLTARGHRLSAADLADTGVRLLMGKPFSTAELLGQVCRLLPTGSQTT